MRTRTGVDNGNAVPEEKAPKVDRSFKPGDVVALTQSALRMPKLQAMSCRVIYSIGMPNEFIVKGVSEREEHGLCLSLYPCCDIRVDRKRNFFYCEGHPAIYFEKVNYRRLPKSGDKVASIVLPLLGEIYRAEYRDDE